ncbi:class I SAM-dependent methyltransferase [Paraoerskovia sediminicola]
MRTFDELVAEADAAPTDGWDFSWFDGRATEERPSWGYARLMAERLGTVDAALDLQTGGGEVLASAVTLPRLMVATESWPPNVAAATALLHPRGVAVVADHDEPPLPFGDAAFDLVTSRHPVVPWWSEIHRVLRPGGRTSPSTWGRRASSSWWSTSSVRSRRRAAAGTPTTRRRAHARRAWRSSTCAPSG